MWDQRRQGAGVWMALITHGARFLTLVTACAARAERRVRTERASVTPMA